MKALDMITLILVIIGGLNWGIMGLFGNDVNIVAMIFGGVDGIITRIIYVLVGLSALYQIMPLVRSMQTSPTM